MNREQPKSVANKKPVLSRKQKTSLNAPVFHQKSEVVRSKSPIERTISTRSTPVIGMADTAPVENFLKSKGYSPHHIANAEKNRYIFAETPRNYPVLIEIDEKDYSVLPVKSTSIKRFPVSDDEKRTAKYLSLPNTRGAYLQCPEGICLVTESDNIYMSSPDGLNVSSSPVPLIHIEDIRNNPQLAESTVSSVYQRHKGLTLEKAHEKMDEVVEEYNLLHHVILKVVNLYDDKEEKEEIKKLEIVSDKLAMLEKYLLKAKEIATILERDLS